MKTESTLLKIISALLEIQLLFSPVYGFAGKKEKKSGKVSADKLINSFLGGMSGQGAQTPGFNPASSVGGAVGSMLGMNLSTYNPQTSFADDYFGTCTLLQEQTDKANMDLCNINSPQAAQFYEDYKRVAEQNANMYKNYSKKGVINNLNGYISPDAARGMKCLRNEATKLQKLLKSRVSEVDDLINLLKKELEKHENIVENKYLKPLKDIQARLYGNKHGKKFNKQEFKKLFKSEACESLEDTDFAKLGESEGLEGVRTSLVSQMEKPYSNGGLKFSPKALAGTSQGKSREITLAITRSARKIARDIKSKIKTGNSEKLNPKGLLNSLKNTTFNIAGMSSIEDAIEGETSSYAELLGDIDAYQKTSNIDASIVDAAKDPNANFQEYKDKYESDFYSRCFQTAFQKQGMSLPTFLTSMKQHNAFKGARVQYQIELTELIENLESGDITYSQFMKSFRKLSPGNTYVLGQAGSSNRVSAQVPMKNAINYCVKEYSRVEEEQRYSTKQVVAKLVKKHEEVRAQAKNLASNVQKSILDRVINCNDSVPGQAANSCSSDAFNMSSAGFCVQGAKTCAANMNLCLSTAKDEIKNVENARSELINGTPKKPGLKQTVATFKAFTQSLFNNFEAKVRATSDDLKKTLKGVNDYPIPTAFTFSLDLEKDALLKDDEDLPEHLKVENPKRYTEKLIKHLKENVRESIVQQNKNILKGDPDLEEPFKDGLLTYVKHIEKSYADEAQAWRNEMTRCEGPLQAYNQQQQKQNIACQNLVALKANPLSAANGLPEDVMKSIAQMPEGAQAYGVLAELKEIKGDLLEFEFSDEGYIDTKTVKILAEKKRDLEKCKNAKKNEIESSCSAFYYDKISRSIAKTETETKTETSFSPKTDIINKELKEISKKLQSAKRYNKRLTSITGLKITSCPNMANNSRSEGKESSYGEDLGEDTTSSTHTN